jgi:hypothetical protein
MPSVPGIRSTAGVVTTAAVVMVGVFSVFEFGEPSVAPEAPPAVASASLLKRIGAADRHGRSPSRVRRCSPFVSR